MKASAVASPNFVVIIDLEATCRLNGGMAQTEDQLIEFAAVLVNVKNSEIVRFVKFV